MSQPQKITSEDQLLAKAKQVHDIEMKKRSKKVTFKIEESTGSSSKNLSLDELLAKANRAMEEGKERDKKLRLMEQESRALRDVYYAIEGLGLPGAHNEMLNKLTTAIKKVDAEDDKIAQYDAFIQQMSKKCDELEQLMAQEALLKTSGSSADGSESVERLDSSASGSIEQETEDIL